MILSLVNVSSRFDGCKRQKLRLGTADERIRRLALANPQRSAVLSRIE